METDKTQLLFMQLVLQNQQIAMMAMGKLENPVTKRIDRNLEYAKVSIDTLDMLQVKTKGNLSEYEEKYLIEVLKELKLTYVEELTKDKNNTSNYDDKKTDDKKSKK